MRDGWEIVPLGKYIKQSKKKVKVVDGEQYPAIGVMMEGRGFVTRPPFIGGKTTYKQLTPIEPNQLVLRSITAWEAPIQVTTNEHSGFHVSGVFPVFDIDVKNLNPQYLSLLCRYNPFWESMRERTVGSVLRRKTLSATALMDIPVHVPPIPEQKRIVNLISSVDSYIEALQQQLESATRSRNAVLHELLTAGGHDWVETTLGQISKCAGGCAFPDAFQGNKEGIPFIKVSDMNSQDNEKYIKTSNNSVSAEVVDDLRLRIWDKGTVIFPKVGAALLTEKRRILTTKTIFDNNIMGLVPNERVLSEFLFLLMLQIRFSDHVQPGAVPSIKNSIVEAISVLLPSLDEQKRIVTIISELDSFIHCTETSMNRTKALRSGLLSQLLSGEHEIPVSYDKVMGAA